MYVVYIRELSGSNHAVLGMVDMATALQQAIRLPSRNAEHVLECFRRCWLMPYTALLWCVKLTLMALSKVLSDQVWKKQPSMCFAFLHGQGHCCLGTVERKNAILRTVVEKMIDENAVTNEGLDWVLAAAISDNQLLATELRLQALRIINEMKASQVIRRALLRKTATSRAEAEKILPGALAAYWRWIKKASGKKRGGYVLGRLVQQARALGFKLAQALCR